MQNFTSGTTTFKEAFSAFYYLLTLKDVSSESAILEYHRLIAQNLAGESIRVYSFSAGRMALYTILKLISSRTKKREVILPGFTCVVVPTAVIYAGFKPVYVDIKTDDFNINIELIKDKITNNTCAILAQHTFGVPCDIEHIIKIANEHKIFVIEDCAHSFGGIYENRTLGTLGDFAFASTDHTKMFSTSIGGFAMINRHDFFEEADTLYNSVPFLPIDKQIRVAFQMLLLNIFRHNLVYPYASILEDITWRLKLPFFCPGCEAPQIPHEYPYPCRLSGFQAKIGISQLMLFAKNLFHRRKVTKRYDGIFKDKFYVQKRSMENPGNPYPLLRYSFLVKNRGKFIREFADLVKVETWYASVLECLYEGLDRLGYISGMCPIAEKISQMIVNFPTHLRVNDRFLSRLEKRLSEIDWRKYVASI